MKAAFWLTLAFAILDPQFAVASDASMQSIEIEIAKVLPLGVVDVLLKTGETSPVNIWRESNSWGVARWRILRVHNGILETYYQNPNRRFSMNIPSFLELTKGSPLSQRLDLNAGNWCLGVHCSSYDERGIDGKEVAFQEGDSIIVVYDVPRTGEAIKTSIWYGVVAAIWKR